MAKVKNTPKVLGLDVSTKTIGWALFDYTSKELLELTHFSPKLKPIPESKTEQLLLKSDSFREVVEKYRGVGITKVIIEEPLLNSNNIFTVSILMRYNAFIMKIIHDVLGVIPELISTYDSRKFAFPSLFVENKKGKKVLFGGYEKGCDKKHIIWQKVSDQQPHITWGYTRNNTLKKENFDMTDAYACVLGHMQKNQLW
jgi:RNase H-fold protein (predicted Holliday junction resolvase)|tara:strand:- start:1308 stop:1904 length:597 start_codon:yes stop_codon:yes gene_type:complete